MSDEPKGRGAVALRWWGRHIAQREIPAARALVARLRRAAPLAVLSEREVMTLARELDLRSSRAADIVRIAVLLAEIREHDPSTLAQRLGGDNPVLSPLRFQRLLRAEGVELTDQLRRAIIMAERRCNVAALASDILHWEAARPRWCFHYFGADAPRTGIEEKTE